MKKAFLFLTILTVSLVLFSCQHETPDTETGSTGPTDTSQISKNLLSRVVKTSGANSTTATYRYDAQNRLIWYANTSTEAGYFEDTSQIVWNTAGQISRIIYRSDSSARFSDPRVDSIIYDVIWDVASSKYKYKLTQYKMYTTKFKDSTAYTYDGQGKISQENAFYFDYKTTKKYIKWATYDYTYNTNGDLANQKTTYYDIDANHTDYSFDIAYTYEEKGINLLHLGNEAIVIGIPESYSGHVQKTMLGTYPLDPKWNQNISYTYKYNTKYRPLQADLVDNMSGAKSTMAFTYQ